MVPASYINRDLSVLVIRPGPKFYKAVNVVDTEFQRVGQTTSIRERLRYGLATKDTLDISESKPSSKYQGMVSFPDERTNVGKKWFRKAHETDIMRASQDTTIQYSQLIKYANDLGNYSFILSGEGSDVGVMALYMSMIKKAPQAILIAPYEKTPKVDIDLLNEALAAMKDDVKYGRIACPKAGIVEDSSLRELAETIRDRVRETYQPYHLVVFGPGKPIFDLIDEHLDDLIHLVLVTHVAPYEWDQSAGTFRFSSTHDALEMPSVERKLLHSNLKRIVIPRGELHLGDFTYVRDEVVSRIFLMNAKEINLSTSGAVKDMGKYLSKYSQSIVGRVLYDLMSQVAKKQVAGVLEDIRLVERGQAKLKSILNGSHWEKAYHEVLRIARKMHVSKHPDHFLDPKTDDNISEQKVINFWNEKGTEALEEACQKFPTYKDLESSHEFPTLRDYER